MKKSIFFEEIKNISDDKNRNFVSKLVPNIGKDKILGVRIPLVRLLAKRLWQERKEECEIFLQDLPHYYFDENNLHACIIEMQKDLKEVFSNTEKFLPYIDNWATCDIFSPKVYKAHRDLKNKDRDLVLEKALSWINSNKIYTVRYGIGILLTNYLDDFFDKEHLSIVSKIKSEEYYINMMIAWYFATALAKQYDATILYIENKVLSMWVHNKTIQKARESRRISLEKKAYLKSFKIR